MADAQQDWQDRASQMFELNAPVNYDYRHDDGSVETVNGHVVATCDSPLFARVCSTRHPYSAIAKRDLRPGHSVPKSKHEAKLDQAAKGFGPDVVAVSSTGAVAVAVKPSEDYHSRKFDNGKSRIDLIPGEALDALGDVLAYGAQKYAPNSWQLVPDAKQRYIGALGRHYAAMLRGETVDEESGKLHVEHILTNAAFITYFERRGL